MKREKGEYFILWLSVIQDGCDFSCAVSAYWDEIPFILRHAVLMQHNAIETSTNINKHSTVLHFIYLDSTVDNEHRPRVYAPHPDPQRKKEE